MTKTLKNQKYTDLINSANNLIHQNPDEAILKYNELLNTILYDEDLKFMEFHIFKGLVLCYSIKNDRNKVFSCIEKILNIKADDIDTLLLLASEHSKEKNFAKCLEVLEKALQFDNNNIDVLMSIGSVNFHLNELENALSAYKKVIEISSKMYLTEYIQNCNLAAIENVRIIESLLRDTEIEKVLIN